MIASEEFLQKLKDAERRFEEERKLYRSLQLSVEDYKQGIIKSSINNPGYHTREH